MNDPIQCLPLLLGFGAAFFVSGMLFGVWLGREIAAKSIRRTGNVSSVLLSSNLSVEGNRFWCQTHGDTGGEPCECWGRKR
jgi:hypothetical protein